ncbi:hypothetical protein COV56_01930 [Candidatus Kuenenbacteria bacterium CG11_big_fil_rev_8_21_14_0_20_37_9]|uniref:Helix-turn-helix domain-containing protein n=2 Tax=Candidatus Kueneniibacteriota TaxID=1752740 RepID=A0A2M6XSW1_9BACT|nr:MAG: hypothetical protein AUJ29_01935 [Candidatus Kuenenbacteria bacterium CG1_02_38_13]PIR05598.1 MAG: hypothetical protein COV56_01930 [Candidatus Kuenenbacteria bacterium CG11_big_fil_rev_8_21_14_0_20_37_9]PIU10727.1 MAG: hypothetical protein COT27_01700 [Candidatus Kuenenbacteria bacterium CG08_land_8_20_14_0_20_37_23]
MSSNIRISPSIASLFFGVSERSIRRAVWKKELSVIVHQGRYKINLNDLIIWSNKKPSRRKKMDEEGIGQYVEKWKI